MYVWGMEKINTEYPRTWAEAEAWQNSANKEEGHRYPQWRFDCGFKLDFDGGMVSVESRFYPPYRNSMSGLWDGTLSVYAGKNLLISKEFSEPTLNLLKIEVEAFYKHYQNCILSRMC